MPIVERAGMQSQIQVPSSQESSSQDFGVRLVKALATNSIGRRLLNAWYARLGPAKRQKFHADYAKIFREGKAFTGAGYWTVRFLDRVIRMPLAAEEFWLSWDTAVSIIGHDIEVKQTYKALLESTEHRPDLFLDIGANYGTHSLLFLVCGVSTLTFEPNSSCHAYIQRACAANKVVPAIKHIALGPERGEVRLVYPKRETWLGSTNARTIAGLEEHAELVTETVRQVPVDDYLPQMNSHRVLIKIDTEGNELSVLKGAEKVLREIRPRIIFECLEAPERAILFDFFGARGYELFALPWSPKAQRRSLTREELLTHLKTNFMAAPR